MLALCSLCLTSVAFSQGVASAENDIPRATAVRVSAPTPPAKEVTITIRNNAEKPVAIFAGPKEGIRDPKVKTLGGLSLNKLYLLENEVVCLMDMTERRPTACTVVKPGATLVEVNPSGTALTSK